MYMEHIIYQNKYDKNNEIMYSIVTPVYNQENIIVKNISSFIEFTTQNFEIIIISNIKISSSRNKSVDVKKLTKYS